ESDETQEYQQSDESPGEQALHARRQARAQIDLFPLELGIRGTLHLPEDVDHVAVDGGARPEIGPAQDGDHILGLARVIELSSDHHHASLHVALDGGMAADTDNVVMADLVFPHAPVAEDPHAGIVDRSAL